MFKKSLLLLVLVAFSCSKTDVFDEGKQIIISPVAKCENGFAGEYPCKDYDLLAHFSLEELGVANGSGNDCWGWTDPETDKEYALMGTSEGVVFIDITNPQESVILGTLKTKTENSIWRDVKVFGSTAYIVSEAADHGMQVFSLNKLTNVTNPPVEFSVDGEYNSFGNAHNIVINEDSGFAYAVGTKTFNGGPHFIDINQPFIPVEAGGYAERGYSHDAQVVTYNGPDTDYAGKEILVASNGELNGINEVVILDVTDKENPQLISTIEYPNQGYTHQGWFTKDFRYFLLGDELDEVRLGVKSRTIIFDFTDLDNPQLHFEYEGPTPAIDHNGYVKDNLFYLANYTAGVRIIDIADIENKNISEIGFFDTFPANNNTAFDGVWSVYPYFKSGNIIVSDSNNGFFLIRKSNT
jgi:choice-of-anchor B domain-containing protein